MRGVRLGVAGRCPYGPGRLPSAAIDAIKLPSFWIDLRRSRKYIVVWRVHGSEDNSRKTMALSLQLRNSYRMGGGGLLGCPHAPRPLRWLCSQSHKQRPVRHDRHDSNQTWGQWVEIDASSPAYAVARGCDGPGCASALDVRGSRKKPNADMAQPNTTQHCPTHRAQLRGETSETSCGRRSLPWRPLTFVRGVGYKGTL